MRSLIAAFALFALTASASADHATLFNEFKATHGRHYSSKAEEAKRFAIFQDNLKVAEMESKKNPLAEFGVNAFSDYSAEEFKTYHNAGSHYKAATAQRGAEVEMSAAEKKVSAGEKIDWRTKGAVTYVKNQGDCGSCWSFSTTGGIEGQWFLNGNTLVALSEQELVSCDTIDSGCGGGIMQNAFKWLLENKEGKIVTEASYPYVSGMGQVPACDCCSTRKFGAQIKSHVDVKKTEDDMAAWVYKNGPLSIAVDATTWQTYTSGIMTDCAKVQIDHGVLIVGFDDTYSTPYWIIKNSWGSSWGESGYIRVQKGTDQCLITSDPTSSVVEGSGPSPTSEPVTPAPAPSEGTFSTLRCSTPECTGCKATVHNQNSCITVGDFSFEGTCATDALIIKAYANANCQGAYNITSEPINVCEVNFGAHGLNTYTMNTCPSKHIMPPSPPNPNPSTAPPMSTPSPMAPTTQAPNPFTPTPGETYFTQKICTDSTCTSGCQSHKLPQNKCLSLTGGGSAKAKCDSSGLTLTEYPTSTDCTGFSIPSTQPVNKCVKDNSGSYLENVCDSSLDAILGDKITKGL